MRRYILAAVSLALFGCSSSGPKIDASRLSEIRKGETTIDEIVSQFGHPNILSKNITGTQTAAYMNASAAGFVPLVAALAGKSDANVDSVIFYFNDKGVLSDYKTTQASARSAAQTERARVQSVAPSAATPVPAESKSSASDGDPWTIKLYPSGYRENRP